MLGSLRSRVALHEVESLRASRHVRRLVRTCLILAPDYRTAEPGDTDLRLDTWAHQLGFRGHFLTKSRKWSTTFSALRAARRDHTRQLQRDSWAALSADARNQITARWDYAGRGYRSQHERRAAELQRQEPPTTA